MNCEIAFSPLLLIWRAILRWHGTGFFIQFTEVRGCVSCKLCKQNFLSCHSAQIALIHSEQGLLPILEKKITSHDLKIFYIVIFPFSVRPFFQIVFSFVVLPQLITCKGLTIRTMYTLHLYMSGTYGFRVSMHYPPILVLFYLPSSVSCNFIM